MPRYGTVLEITGDRAIITTSRRGVCDGCTERSRCSFDSALGKDSPERVTAINTIGAQPGDAVEFDLTGRTELKVSFVIWVAPLIGLVAGAVTGSIFHDLVSLSKDFATFLGAVAGLFLTLVPMVILDRRLAHDQRLVPHITRRVDPASCPDLHR